MNSVGRSLLTKFLVFALFCLGFLFTSTIKVEAAYTFNYLCSVNGQCCNCTYPYCVKYNWGYGCGSSADYSANCSSNLILTWSYDGTCPTGTAGSTCYYSSCSNCTGCYGNPCYMVTVPNPGSCSVAFNLSCNNTAGTQAKVTWNISTNNYSPALVQGRLDRPPLGSTDANDTWGTNGTKSGINYFTITSGQQNNIRVVPDGGTVCTSAYQGLTCYACGNGIREGTEQCDAGASNGVVCTPPYNGSCTYCTTSCTSITRTGPRCGDSIIQTANGENCDNGASNTTSCTAAYNSSCTYCSSSTCRLTTVYGTSCGDGIIQTANGETCDNGASNGVACTAAYNSSCTYCSSTCRSTTLYGPRCGDSIIQTANGENCDNGASNTTSCTASYNSSCTYCSSTNCTLRTVTGPRCGDSIIQTANGENCDNGASNGVACTPAYNSSCSYCNSSCSLTTVTGGVCGDGIVNGSEVCDAGASNGVACTPTYNGSCTYCSNSCSNVTLTGAFCGDGTVNGSEACDNGASNGVACYPDYGSTCSYCSSSCSNVTLTGSYCGDGSIDMGEECDSGANNGVACTAPYGGSCSFCSSSCTLASSTGGFCGDGTVNGSEVCDSGINNGVLCVAPYNSTCNYCTSSCTSASVTGPFCGDGSVNGSEACDGGICANNMSCSSSCTCPANMPPSCSSMSATTTTPMYGDTITISAAASDATGTVNSVAFYRTTSSVSCTGLTLIGNGTYNSTTGRWQISLNTGTLTAGATYQIYALVNDSGNPSLTCSGNSSCTTASSSCSSCALFVTVQVPPSCNISSSASCNVNGSSIDLNWNATSNVSAYQIEGRLNASPTTDFPTGTGDQSINLGTLFSGSRNISVVQNTDITTNVAFYNTVPNSSRSNYLCNSTAQVLRCNAAPTCSSLTASNTMPTFGDTITLSAAAADTAGGVTSVAFYRTTSSVACTGNTLIGNGVYNSTTGRWQISLNTGTLLAGTTYQIYAKVNDNGVPTLSCSGNTTCNSASSSCSSCATFVSIQVLPQCNVTSTASCNPNGTSVNISWNATSNVTPYLVEGRFNASPTTDWPTGPGDQSINLATAGTELTGSTNVSVAPNIDYSQNVAVYNIVPNSARSNYLCSSNPVVLRCNAAPTCSSLTTTNSMPVYGTSITLSAAASDPTGSVSSVSFYRTSNSVSCAANTLLGNGTFNASNGRWEYVLNTTGLTIGSTYQIYAVVNDNGFPSLGCSGNISCTSASSSCPSCGAFITIQTNNQPPLCPSGNFGVSESTPLKGEFINLWARPTDTTGVISSVSFYWVAGPTLSCVSPNFAGNGTFNAAQNRWELNNFNTNLLPAGEVYFYSVNYDNGSPALGCTGNSSCSSPSSVCSGCQALVNVQTAPSCDLTLSHSSIERGQVATIDIATPLNVNTPPLIYWMSSSAVSCTPTSTTGMSNVTLLSTTATQKIWRASVNTTFLSEGSYYIIANDTNSLTPSSSCSGNPGCTSVTNCCGNTNTASCPNCRKVLTVVPTCNDFLALTTSDNSCNRVRFSFSDLPSSYNADLGTTFTPASSIYNCIGTLPAGAQTRVYDCQLNNSSAPLEAVTVTHTYRKCAGGLCVNCTKAFNPTLQKTPPPVCNSTDFNLFVHLDDLPVNFSSASSPEVYRLIAEYSSLDRFANFEPVTTVGFNHLNPAPDYPIPISSGVDRMQYIWTADSGPTPSPWPVDTGYNFGFVYDKFDPVCDPVDVPPAVDCEAVMTAATASIPGSYLQTVNGNTHIGDTDTEGLTQPSFKSGISFSSYRFSSSSASSNIWLPGVSACGLNPTVCSTRSYLLLSYNDLNSNTPVSWFNRIELMLNATMPTTIVKKTYSAGTAYSSIDPEADIVIIGSGTGSALTIPAGSVCNHRTVYLVNGDLLIDPDFRISSTDRVNKGCLFIVNGTTTVAAGPDAPASADNEDLVEAFIITNNMVTSVDPNHDKLRIRGGVVTSGSNNFLRNVNYTDGTNLYISDTYSELLDYEGARYVELFKDILKAPQQISIREVNYVND